jgi:hypothetical protein
LRVCGVKRYLLIKFIGNWPESFNISACINRWVSAGSRRQMQHRERAKARVNYVLAGGAPIVSQLIVSYRHRQTQLFVCGPKVSGLLSGSTPARLGFMQLDTEQIAWHMAGPVVVIAISSFGESGQRVLPVVHRMTADGADYNRIWRHHLLPLKI